MSVRSRAWSRCPADPVRMAVISAGAGNDCDPGPSCWTGRWAAIRGNSKARRHIQTGLRETSDFSTKILFFETEFGVKDHSDTSTIAGVDCAASLAGDVFVVGCVFRPVGPALWCFEVQTWTDHPVPSCVGSK